MKAIDLIQLIQKTCKVDDEIFITSYTRYTSQGKVTQRFDPDINITRVDATDERGELRDIDHNEVPAGKTFHIW
jgi:hypothetical protein